MVAQPRYKQKAMTQPTITAEEVTEHYFELEFPARLVTLKAGNLEIASSYNVIMLKEKGWKLYNPVYSFPKQDVSMDLLEVSDHATHCPIKGYTRYYSVKGSDQRFKDSAWTYIDTIENASVIKDMIAFDQEQFTLIFKPVVPGNEEK